MSKPVPYAEDRDGKGTLKRTYWPRGDAMDKRREMREQLESDLAKKSKKWVVADKKKALDDKWGQYCDTRRSLDER